MQGFIRRSIYLLYYIKLLNWKKFEKFFQYVKAVKHKSFFALFTDILKCIYTYNIDLMDYFVFRFYEKPASERSEWAGTGFMYEYQLKMNPPETRYYLADKLVFLKEYTPFVKRRYCSIEDIMENNLKAEEVLSNPTGKIVIKDSRGQCGWNVEVINSDDFPRDSLIRYMSRKRFNLAEEYIKQHPELEKLSESGLNSVRIITQLGKNNQVELLGARLRISVNNHVDNLASGNLGAAVDIETGKVSGTGVYSDITRQTVSVHPVSQMQIPGFQIPFWPEALELARNAALYHPENKSVGWDIAISGNGTELLEGNHNWCKILWQLPVNKGLKKELEKYS